MDLNELKEIRERLKKGWVIHMAQWDQVISLAEERLTQGPAGAVTTHGQATVWTPVGNAANPGMPSSGNMVHFIAPKGKNHHYMVPAGNSILLREMIITDNDIILLGNTP
jgi:hypothetical protein